MTERPILFSGPMVRAILAGTKTVTRRIIRDDWFRCLDPDDERDMPNILAQCPYGGAGDRLWVRERMRVFAWRVGAGVPQSVGIRYEADGVTSDIDPWPARLKVPDVGKCLAYGGPREGSRITLEIVSVRAERLQDITPADAAAEGVECCAAHPGEVRAVPAFRDLWEQINGKRASWESNPWVWRVEFRRVAP